MLGDILKTVIMSRFSKESSSSSGSADVYLPEINFSKYFVSSPNVQTSQVQSAARPTDLQATSKYFRFLESLMRSQ